MSESYPARPTSGQPCVWEDDFVISPPGYIRGLPQCLHPDFIQPQLIDLYQMARLIELQEEADAFVEYEMYFSESFSLLIIVAVSSSWTIPPTEIIQVGEEPSVILLGSRKPSRTGFRQREDTYLHVSRKMLKPPRKTLYKTPREACCFSGHGWKVMRPGILPITHPAGLEDEETAFNGLYSLFAKVLGALWCNRYDFGRHDMTILTSHRLYYYLSQKVEILPWFKERLE